MPLGGIQDVSGAVVDAARILCDRQGDVCAIQEARIHDGHHCRGQVLIAGLCAQQVCNLRGRAEYILACPVHAQHCMHSRQVKLPY